MMTIRYYNLYTHFVLTTQDRKPIINGAVRERLEKYIAGIINNHDSKLYSIYANPEHVHFLVSRSPRISEQLLASVVAEGSQSFIQANRLIAGNFRWQDTCAAFSVSKSEVDRVCKYILAQPEHHKKTAFAEEYELMIKHYSTGVRWNYLK